MAKALDNGADSTAFGKISSGLVQLLNNDAVSRDYVRFRLDLASVQQALATAATGAMQTGAGSPAALLDEALLPDGYARIVEAARRYAGASEELARLGESVTSSPQLLGAAVRGFLEGNGESPMQVLELATGVSPGLARYIVGILCSPVLTVWREHHLFPGNCEPVGQDARRCPVCGEEAALSVLRRDDGRRSLYCGVCGMGWPYQRIGCPFCGCTDQSRLGVMFAEDNRPESLETCSNCRSYIKSIDERKTPEDEELLLYVAETATLYLDLIAEQEGFERRALFVALA